MLEIVSFLTPHMMWVTNNTYYFNHDIFNFNWFLPVLDFFHYGHAHGGHGGH